MSANANTALRRLGRRHLGQDAQCGEPDEEQVRMDYPELSAELSAGSAAVPSCDPRLPADDQGGTLRRADAVAQVVQDAQLGFPTADPRRGVSPVRIDGPDSMPRSPWMQQTQGDSTA